MMMTCERSRELFPEALYSELAPGLQNEFAAHLASCPSCRTEFEALQATLQIMNQRIQPQPNRDFLESYWDRLNARFPADDKKSRPAVASGASYPGRPARVPAWAYGIAAVLLMAVGVYLGRTYFGGPPPGVPRNDEHLLSTGPTPDEDSTSDQAVAYLERSKNLLIGLTNLDEEHRSSLDLSRNQEVSRELIQQANVLTVALNRPDQQQMRRLIQDLEVILLQLANIDVKPGVPAIELVQKGVDQRSILLKINLEEMRAIARRSPPNQSKKTNL
ncbi:MAG TPA: zf-HC2 domain-containing protein [Bacteroidota bacterium]|nr:zf-HC2 domain-containing protein [Bacteroidota bacterium]